MNRVRSRLYVTGSYFALPAGNRVALVDEVVASLLRVANHLIVAHAGFLSDLAPSIFAVLFYDRCNQGRLECLSLSILNLSIPTSNFDR